MTTNQFGVMTTRSTIQAIDFVEKYREPSKDIDVVFIDLENLFWCTMWFHRPRTTYVSVVHGIAELRVLQKKWPYYVGHYTKQVLFW